MVDEVNQLATGNKTISTLLVPIYILCSSLRSAEDKTLNVSVNIRELVRVVLLSDHGQCERDMRRGMLIKKL